MRRPEDPRETQRWEAEKTERDPVYYRVYQSPKDDCWSVVCMQDFDEFGYDQSRFLNDIKYPTEEAARRALGRIFLRQQGSGFRVFFDPTFLVGPGAVLSEDQLQRIVAILREGE
jgi:hypothetical protein